MAGPSPMGYRSKMLLAPASFPPWRDGQSYGNLGAHTRAAIITPRPEPSSEWDSQNRGSEQSRVRCGQETHNPPIRSSIFHHDRDTVTNSPPSRTSTMPYRYWTGASSAAESPPSSRRAPSCRPTSSKTTRFHGGQPQLGRVGAVVYANSCLALRFSHISNPADRGRPRTQVCG